MTHLVFHRDDTRLSRRTALWIRPLPRGVGLTIGAAISIGLWSGLFVLAARLLA